MTIEFSAIRRDKDGEVDDVAIDGVTMRLERLDGDFWWAAAYRGADAVHFDIFIRDGRIVVTARDDTIGCYDDSGEWHGGA